VRTSPFLFAIFSGGSLVASCGGSTVTSPGTGSDSGLSSSGGSSSGSGSGSSTSSGGAPDGMAASEGGVFGCQCASGQTCCVGAGGGPGGRTFSCGASCPTGSLAVACTSAQACGAGQQCCYLPSATMPSATNVSACMTACPPGARATCTTDTDCPAGSTCQQQSGGAYGFMTCRMTPPCMGTMDCATGQVCCTGVAGAADACQMGATCPSGSSQICAGPMDCGSGQVCCTSAADGGGASTCTSGTSCPSGSTLLCNTSADCEAGTVCCQGGGQTCQIQSACGARGNRQICAGNSECPASYPLCQNMTCRGVPDGGTPPDSGGPVDAAAEGG
jgi:hypothetical protein